MGDDGDKRHGTLAMRISPGEHARLKSFAADLGRHEAEVVREAVNAYAELAGRAKVFGSVEREGGRR